MVSRIRLAIQHGDDIATLLAETPIMPELERCIEAGLSELQNVGMFAVRSSGLVWSDGVAVGEDSDSVSLAGQFESYLSVPRSRIASAVQACWASMFNARSVSRFGGTAGFISKSLMAVIVQEMIPAEACAVVMTVDPNGKGDTGAIEFCWGACEGLVSGIISPDEALFLRQSGELISKRLGRKEYVVKHTEFAVGRSNVVKTHATEHQRSQFSLSDSDIRRLISLSMEIEAIFRRPQDIEAVFSPSGELVITQARSITVLPRQASSGPNPTIHDYQHATS